MDELALRRELRDNFEFYAQHCLKIKDKLTAQIVPFAINDAQRVVLADRNAQLKERGYVRQINLKGRQQGVSTLIEGIGFQKVTNNAGIAAYILTHEAKATEALFAMVKRYHDHCPPQMLPRLTSDSNKRLDFGGIDSGYGVGTAGAKASGRGQNLQFFHGSEVAFWANATEHAAGVMNAVLDEGEGTETYLESTANGVGDYFNTQWQMAVRGEGQFRAVFVPWFMQREYRTNSLPKDWQRTAEEEQLAVNFNLTDTQLAWRRNKIVALSGNGVKGDRLFKQEYPCYPDEAFQMTGEQGLILPEDVIKARKFTGINPSGPRIMGIDPSLGGDRFAIATRQGRVLTDMRHKQGDDVKTFGQRVNFCLTAIKELDPDYVYVDQGYGADLVDRLRELVRTPIRSISFGGSPTDDNIYINKRAEMYGELAKWLIMDNEPVSIIDSDEIHADLCATLYTTDSAGRLQLLPKDRIKKLLGFSPDLSDAIALTFAEPIVNFTFGRTTKRPVIRGRV